MVTGSLPVSQLASFVHGARANPCPARAAKGSGTRQSQAKIGYFV
jgi:hypothetical protein